MPVNYTKPDATKRRVIGLMEKPSGHLCDCPPNTICICEDAPV
jgi:hypothetical protein